MGVLTRMEVQKHNKERVNVYLDDEYAFSLTLIEAAQLHKGQVLTQAEIDRLRDADAVQQAVDQAARFLSYRPRSSAEVRQNLSGKGYSESTVAAALERLATLGYLDDLAFTRYWLENRETFRPRGPLALRYELRQKGVQDALIDAVLAESYDEADAAFRAAQDRSRRLRGTDRATFRKRLLSFLQRRGFSYGVCQDAINQLADSLAEEDPAFFGSSESDDSL